MAELEAVTGSSFLPASSTGSSKLAVVMDGLKYFGRTNAGKIMLKIASILAGGLSAVVLWSEVTIALGSLFSVNLSPFGLLIPPTSAVDGASVLSTQVLISIPLIYMSICLYTRFDSFLPLFFAYCIHFLSCLSFLAC
jgi:hypothetical protein